LLFALGISLAVHVVLFAFAVTVLGVALLRDPDLLRQIAQSPEKIIELTAQRFETTPPRPDQVQPEPEKQMPMLFIEVDPTQNVTDEPKKAKYYAAQNTLAANPDTRLETEQPKIDGKQTQIIRAFEAPRAQPKPQALQPSPQPQARVQSQPEQKAQNANNPNEQKQSQKDQSKQERGDLDMLRPPPSLLQQQTAQESQPKQRPKTLAEARMRENDSRPPGERMKQEGGTKRFSDVASLEAIGTPLGNYDALIIEAIRSKWYALLDETKHAGDRKGHVVVVFRLYSNGTVRNVRTDDQDVGELLSYLCQSAVLTPAPYAKWPADVRAAVGKDYRDVKFTFFYN